MPRGRPPSPAPHGFATIPSGLGKRWRWTGLVGGRAAPALAATLAVLAAGVPAEAAAAKRKQPRRPVVSVAILTLTQQDAHDSGVLRVELGTKGDATVHVRGLLREPGGQMIVPRGASAFGGQPHDEDGPEHGTGQYL